MSLRKTAFFGILCAATLTYLFAQTSVSGYWVIHNKMPDGNVRDTFLHLTQDGDHVAGSMINNFNESKLEGSFANGKLNLKTEIRRTRSIVLSGSFENGNLALTQTVEDSDSTRPIPPPMHLLAEPSTAEAAAPPAKLPVPAMHDVPDNGLARTPPMGWNSWNHFAGKIDDPTVRAIADAMVSNGMQKAGYQYVNIDDTWEGPRDSSGHITTNPKFPDMKALADYVHSKGLKIGIYSSPGPKTCAGYPGSYGYEEKDAQTYAAWGIDYLKYDWCSAHAIYSDSEMQPVYQKMGDALQATGRPIVYSLCQYGRADVWTWGTKVGGNLWRTTGDISDRWSSLENIGFKQFDIASYIKPGHWNDPDMLEVGNGGMTEDEYKVHMALWSLLSAPLLAGNDLRNMAPETLAMLTNSDVIAIDQDSAANPPQRLTPKNNTEVWYRSLSDGSRAVALFNRNDHAAPVSFDWSAVGLSGKLEARDLWKHAEVSLAGDSFTSDVPKHGVVFLRVKKA